MTTAKHEFVDDYPFLVYTDEVDTTGGTVKPATADSIGGVIVGDGIDVTEDGTISVKPIYATVNMEYSDYPSASNTFGYFVYANYDEDDEKWIIDNDFDVNWNTIFGAGNNGPKIVPYYMTILPNNENVGLFFISNAETTNFSGNITLTPLYYNSGSEFGNATYLIDGDCSIHQYGA